MRIHILLHVVSFLLLLGLGTYVYLNSGHEKTAFVNNQVLFDKFKGSQELKAKLSAQEKQYRTILDSLATLIRGGRVDLNAEYQSKNEQFTMQYQQMTEQYTADLWKTINAGVLAYGKENGYDYILGAAGNGSLMYARESKDITAEVAAHLNASYEGKTP